MQKPSSSNSWLHFSWSFRFSDISSATVLFNIKVQGDNNSDILDGLYNKAKEENINIKLN